MSGLGEKGLLPCPFCGGRDIQIRATKIGDYFAICHSDYEGIPEDDFTPDGIKRVISGNNDMLDAWYAARGITTKRMEMKAEIASLIADRAAQAERMARLDEALGKMRAAVTWISAPFVDENTTLEELRKRVAFCVSDAALAARALSQGGSDA